MRNQLKVQRIDFRRQIHKLTINSSGINEVLNTFLGQNGSEFTESEELDDYDDTSAMLDYDTSINANLSKNGTISAGTSAAQLQAHGYMKQTQAVHIRQQLHMSDHQEQF
jgi:hypothetical protein